MSQLGLEQRMTIVISAPADRKNTSSMKISTMKPVHIRPSLITTTVASPLQEEETQSPEDFAYELLEELEEVCDTRTSEEKLSIIEDYLSDLSEDFKGSPQSEVDRFAIILMHDSMSLLPLRSWALHPLKVS